MSNIKVEGELLKRYTLSYWGEFMDSYDTATEALSRYDKHNQVIRAVIDPKRKGRYTIRDGNKEITIRDLRIAGKKEQAAATAKRDQD